MNTLVIEKKCLISIYELKMPKICGAKKPTFGNLATHHINGSKSFTFSTWNLQNKDNTTLRRLLLAS
jgi:hypothetical protein